jgi:hypothetical protein
VAFFEGFGVVAFAPVTDFGAEASGDQVTGGGSAGRVGCVRVQEVRGQGGGAGGAEAFGFVGKDLGVLPGDGPRLEKASKASGREQIWRDWVTSAPAAGELMVRTPAISSTADISA